YNTIVARYVSFRELWRRTIQEKEEGLQRGRMTANAQPEEEGAPQFKPVQVAFSSGQEMEEARHLYNSLVQAKNQCGEVNNISFDQFQRLIATRTVELRTRLNCQKVAYEVAIE